MAARSGYFFVQSRLAEQRRQQLAEQRAYAARLVKTWGERLNAQRDDDDQFERVERQIPAQDPWGEPLIVDYRDEPWGEGFTIRSIGQDREEKTMDDIVSRYDNVSVRDVAQKVGNKIGQARNPKWFKLRDNQERSSKLDR